MHRDVSRIDENFVKCYECGETILQAQNRMTNKTSRDFVQEDKSFRYRKNNSSRYDKHTDYTPKVSSYCKKKYYADRNWINVIMIDYNSTLNTRPVKFRVKLNGQYDSLTLDEILNVIQKLRLIEIDEQGYNEHFGYEL